jgi:hypothetical protein
MKVNEVRCESQIGWRVWERVGGWGGEIKPKPSKDNQAILEMVVALEATQTLKDPCLQVRLIRMHAPDTIISVSKSLGGTCAGNQPTMCSRAPWKRTTKGYTDFKMHGRGLNPCPC